MKRSISVLLALLAAVASGVLSPGATADAQPMCSEGALVGDKCEIEGDAPIQSASTCPTERSGVFLVGNSCFRLIKRVEAQCPQGTVGVADDMCREGVVLVAGPLRCQAGYELVGSRCVKYVNPTCGPLGCRGKITMSYTVSCVGDGTSRVALGTPTLVNGAAVSFITVNGSAVVGADIKAGSQVSVVVTPERLNDEVIVTGPTIAPACGVTAPTAASVPATPTSTPAPPTPAPPPATTVPAPATAVPAPEPTATQTAVADPPAEPSPTPEPITTVDAVEQSSEDREQQGLDASPLACPQGQAIVDLQCVPPCANAAPDAVCFDVSGRTLTNPPAQPVDAAPNDADPGSDLPIIPLALIGGATLVLAPATYVFATKRFG